MGGFIPLPLKSHDGLALPHTFYEGESAGLLVVLPGLDRKSTRLNSSH